MKSEMYPVVFICDEAYAMPTAVAVFSLKLTKKRETEYHVYVLGIDLSPDSRNRLASMTADGFIVEVLDMVLTDRQMEVVPVRERITRAALLKFDLPQIFPQYDRILYLDSDVAVQRDISELFSFDLQDVYAGVVKDRMTYAETKGHLLWLEFKEEFYFNTGVLLLNLDCMRRDNMSEKLLEYRLHGKNFFMDQDAFNVVFQGKVLSLPVRYNLLNCFFEWDDVSIVNRFYETDFTRCRALTYQEPSILHFGDARKPWKCEMGTLSELYKELYSLSPYADIPLVLEEEQRRREELADLNTRLTNTSKQLASTKEKLNLEKSRYKAIAGSRAFKIGRMITYIPRMIRKVILALLQPGHE